MEPDEELARIFHDTYERLAPAFGYRTRKASAVLWENVPEPNKRLMIAVAREILANHRDLFTAADATRAATDEHAEGNPA